MSTTFRRLCRDCEIRVRTERKNADRPLALIRYRAAKLAKQAGVSLEFVMTQLNYVALVPILRAMLTAEGLCLNCGHRFRGERDVQIDHIEPPRGLQDWARLHARNLRLFCATSNQTKGHKPFAEWLDEQEGARLSNLAAPAAQPMPTGQLALFAP